MLIITALTDPTRPLRLVRACPVVIALLIATLLDAHGQAVLEGASDADNACASVAAYAFTHAEAKILPLIRSCSEHANKRVCEITISMMKDADPVQERTYGLTCVGKP